MKCVSCAFYVARRHLRRGNQKREERRQTGTREDEGERRIPDRWCTAKKEGRRGGAGRENQKRGDAFEGWNTPEIPDRVKIIARLFKHLTDRPRTRRQLFAPFFSVHRTCARVRKRASTRARLFLCSTSRFLGWRGHGGKTQISLDRYIDLRVSARINDQIIRYTYFSQRNPSEEFAFKEARRITSAYNSGGVHTACHPRRDANIFRTCRRLAVRLKVAVAFTATSKIARSIFRYGERAFVRMYESVMKRLRVTETLMGVVFVRRNKVGWMLPAGFADDTVRSGLSANCRRCYTPRCRLIIDNSGSRN